MSVNLFGRSYEQAGSSNADFLIKTRGQVKIQYGSKFIDLIKDGKINTEAKFIYKEKEVGVKDGIYVIGDGEEAKVVLLVSGEQIDLKGEVGTTYVSFLSDQETTSDAKYNALQNIGFIYKDLNTIPENSLKNGIVYIESEQKLYIVQEGVLTEYNISIPTPYTQQFIIAKTDDEVGALVIKGEGKSNGLLFDTLSIYSTTDESTIKSNGQLAIYIADNQKMLINKNQIVFSNNVISSMFQSQNATSLSGFRLYMDADQSTLEVDNLVVRNDNSSVSLLFPEYWTYSNNIISNITKSEDGYIISLYYNNEFKVGDTLYTYYGQRELATFTVTVIDEKTITVTSDITDTAGFINQTIFLVKREQTIIPHISKLGYNIENDSSISRFGDLSDLNLQSSTQSITGAGIYSEQIYSKKAAYIDEYNLDYSDNSTNFASTEWVNNLMSTFLPKGCIIMYNGTTIPDGWAICDGTNGTPNLIGKFIKASNVAGETGGSNQIQLTEENLPQHSHTITITTTNIQQGEEAIATIDNTSSVETSTGQTGNGTPIEWEPSYYSLIYIIKL